jgi:branched-chain amino acid transport system substrate-binding protein
VIGGAFDGAQEWLNIADNENLFPNFTVNDNTKIFTTTGDYLASQGATKVAGVAYNSPSSAAALEAGFVSAEAAGLSRGYANDSVAFGSSDVGPIVLGIIDSGADALQLTINPDTAFAIIAGLAQAGYPMKAIVSPTGYGAELLASAPAVQIAQGVTFTSSYAPVEVGTEAADYERQALMDYTDSESGVPGFFVSMGWFAGDLLLHGLELAGCDATQEEFIAALGDDDTWDAGGLYPNPIPMNAVGSDEQCLFAVKLTGNEFVPVEGASPLCGGRVDG